MTRPGEVYAPSTSTPAPYRRAERIVQLEAQLAAARAEVETKVAAARSDALEEAARIVGTFGRLAVMADPGPFATVNYALVPLDADHIPNAIRAARTAEAPHGR